jgi:hypothetical protein
LGKLLALDYGLAGLSKIKRLVLESSLVILQLEEKFEPIKPLVLLFGITKQKKAPTRRLRLFISFKLNPRV